MAAEEVYEEKLLIQAIQQQLDGLPSLIENARWKEVVDSVLCANWNLEMVVDSYSANHPTWSNSQETIDIDHSSAVQNLVLYDILMVIGPEIFPASEDVDWEFLSTSLNVSTELLQSVFLNVRGMFRPEEVERIVRIILKAGTIRDYDQGGLVLMSFVVCFLLLQEVHSGGCAHLAQEFYSHLEDYSFNLLITSILSIPPLVRNDRIE